MSATASLELCKELYELSGWEASAWWWLDKRKHQNGTLVNPEQIPILTHHSDGYNKLIAKEDQEWWAGYDLGYLLRKLPRGCFIKVAQTDELFYLAEYEYNKASGATRGTGATTPEDAACKLAIELFKQRVLNKEATDEQS
jgi:hypothetical protein